MRIIQAIFQTELRPTGENGVCDLDVSGVAEVVERDVRVSRALVREDDVTVREGPTAHVLTAQPNTAPWGGGSPEYRGVLAFRLCLQCFYEFTL